MRDGHTRKQAAPWAPSPARDFLALFRATLVVTRGPEEGAELPVHRASVTVGRGPSADLVLADDLLSHEHFALEVTSEGLRIRDLGSLNGITVNGSEVKAAEVEHGDRVVAGHHEFVLLLEED